MSVQALLMKVTAPNGTDAEAPRERLAARRQLADGFNRRYGRLIRLAVEVDETVHELAALPLKEGHALQVALMAAHLEIALDGLRQLQFDLEHYGEHRWMERAA